VATVDLLVVENIGADGIFGPLGVFGVGQLVVFADKHGDGDFVDVFDGDEVGLLVGGEGDEVVVVRGPDLEAVFLHDLSVMQDTLDGGAVGLVIHHDLETGLVIVLGV